MAGIPVMSGPTDPHAWAYRAALEVLAGKPTALPESAALVIRMLRGAKTAARG